MKYEYKSTSWDPWNGEKDGLLVSSDPEAPEGDGWELIQIINVTVCKKLDSFAIIAYWKRKID